MCPFLYIAQILCALLCEKEKKMDNFMCLLEFEFAKTLKAHSWAIPGYDDNVSSLHQCHGHYSPDSKIHGASMGPTGPRWAPCWPYELCYLGVLLKVQWKQGKSEGFESCDRPIVWKRPIWVKLGDVLSRVTLKFDGWTWKAIGHLFFAVSSFVQHFIAIGELKLELQSGNAQFESNSTIFRAMWPWNLTDDLEKQ